MLVEGAPADENGTSDMKHKGSVAKQSSTAPATLGAR